MRILEIEPHNEVGAVFLKIKTGFENEYSNLKNLIEYIESNKNPYVDKSLLVNIEDLEHRLIRFLSSRLITKTDPDRPRLKFILKQVNTILKQFR